MHSPRYRFAGALMIAVIVLALPSRGLGQSALEDAIKQYNGDAVKGYIQPVADMFGANMHAGYFHSASIPKTGFVFAFDIIGMASLVGDAQKTYTANAPAGFAPATFQTATVFGGKGTEVSNTANPSLRYKGSDGIFNTSAFPLAVPQITFGSVYGTVGVLRIIAVPKLGDGKVPAVTLWGLGARHSVSQYFPKLPVDLAAGIYYDHFKAGDLVDFSGLMIGAHASKTLGILTVYGGVAWEKSSLNLKYTSTDPAVPLGVDISLDGANSFRGTLGLKLALGFFKIFADANVGSVTNFSGGIGFGY